MFSCIDFVKVLQKNNIGFFTGVPDSLLKDACLCISETIEEHYITANEGAAIGLATGNYLSTGRVPVVYMQNSGLGNAVNPLSSLTHEKIYSIPMILLIGWRGEPNQPDEPQHIKMGAITEAILKALDIPVFHLEKSAANPEKQLEDAIQLSKSSLSPVALLVSKGFFSPYVQTKNTLPSQTHLMSREDAIKEVARLTDRIDNSVIIATTGMISRELFSYRHGMGEIGKDFYVVGSMGHASEIAAGFALGSNNKRVFCFDGDGALIMHLGSLLIEKTIVPESFCHIVFDNEAHDSVGGQPTAAQYVSLERVAEGCGYQSISKVTSLAELEPIFSDIINRKAGPHFVLIKVKRGNRADLMRPTLTPQENKKLFWNRHSQ